MDWMLDYSTVKYLIRTTMSEIAIAYIAALVAVIAMTVWWRGNANKNRPPGPRGLPLVGYLPWIDTKAPHLTLSKLVDRYGKIFRLDMGGVSVVVMADHKVIRETLNLKSTTGRAPLYLTHGIMKGYGLICAEGWLWRDHRKFVAGFMRDHGMRAAAARADMEPRIQAVASNLAEELSHSQESVDISAKLLHHVGNTMNQLVFGLTYADEDPTWKWLRNLLEEGTKLVGVAGPMNFLPWLRFLPMYQRVIRFITENQQKTHQEYQKIINAKEDSLRNELGGQDSQETERKERKEISDPAEQGFNRATTAQGIQTENSCSQGEKVHDPESETGRCRVKTVPETLEQNNGASTENHCQGRTLAKKNDLPISSSSTLGSVKQEFHERSHHIHASSMDSSRVQNGSGTEQVGSSLETANTLKNYSPQNIIEAYIKERSERGENVGSFTYEQLHHVAADLFGAGSETTITTLKWHLLNMALFPDIQTRVQEELDECARGSNQVTLDQSTYLPFTNASIMETQRLRSIVPLGIPHGASEDLTIAGYNIPAGTMLLPLLWFVHHDSSVWDNPDQYNPERFINEDGKLIRQHPAFMPFQTGRRMCIGDEFAKMILFLFTTRLLLQFRVTLDDEELQKDPATDPICGISLCPRPFKLIFTPRVRD